MGSGIQRVLTGKTNMCNERQDFLFRRVLTCKYCGYSPIGEIQKGHTYYRCHIKTCPVTCVREEIAEEEVQQGLSPLEFSEGERTYFQKKIAHLREDWDKEREAQINALSLKLSQIQGRLNRLTDAYIDQGIDRGIFEERKTSLLIERKDLEERLAELRENLRSVPDRLAEFLEPAGSAYLSYKMGLPEKKRDLLKIVTSNREVYARNVSLRLSLPFNEVANRFQNSNGAPGVTRTRGTRIRNPLLYPPELQGQCLSIYNLAIFASMKNFERHRTRQDLLKGSNDA